MNHEGHKFPREERGSLQIWLSIFTDTWCTKRKLLHIAHANLPPALGRLSSSSSLFPRASSSPAVRSELISKTSNYLAWGNLLHASRHASLKVA